MRVAIVADARSPIAQGWISAVSEFASEVHVLSSRVPNPSLDNQRFTPLGPQGAYEAMATRLRRPAVATTGGQATAHSSADWGRRIKTTVTRSTAPTLVRVQSRQLGRQLTRIEPDIVHALRIPFEGMAAARAWRGPLAISIWGNDLTLHASKSRALLSATRAALEGADGLHTDCHRDLRLAKEFGWRSNLPHLVAPGGGGIRETVQPSKSEARSILGLPQGVPIILNPRGIREYTRPDAFIAAMRQVLSRHPTVRFVVLGLEQDPALSHAIRELPAERVLSIGHAKPADMTVLFRAADISVSLTVHDGTPNTLLEAMAVGCFPLVSPLESVLEWVTPEVNGLTADPNSPSAIAEAMMRTLSEPELRNSASIINANMVQQRASRDATVQAIENFYKSVLA